MCRSSFARIIVAFTCVACGSRSLEPGTDVPAEPVHAAVAPAAQPAVTDPNAPLLESTTRMAGVALPRGLQEVARDGIRHVYRSEASIAQLRRYFGQRVISGEVENVGSGIRYVRATARTAAQADAKLNISIYEVADGARVDVEEIPLPPLIPPSEEELLRRATEAMRENMKS